MIAPEETRSVSPRLGPFKKSAFHIAMQTGAPIVPVVLRNTYTVLPRHSVLFRPGTVQVCVLPPIDVTAWKIENLDRNVAAMAASGVGGGAHDGQGDFETLTLSNRPGLLE